MRVRMMRQVLMQAITNERADGDVDLSLTHQLAVVHDAGEQTGEHQPYRYLGIDAGADDHQGNHNRRLPLSHDRSSTPSTRTSTWSSGMS